MNNHCTMPGCHFVVLGVTRPGVQWLKWALHAIHSGEIMDGLADSLQGSPSAESC